MSVGERIIELRKKAGLSQADLSKMMGVSRQAVSKWENDLSVPEPLKLIQLADILDTDIEYLSSGRMNMLRRPPVVLNEVKIVEKVVEKPVLQVKTVEKVVEVPVVQYIEKPTIKRVYRTRYHRNPFEFLLVAMVAFFLGLLIGFLL